MDFSIPSPETTTIPTPLWVADETDILCRLERFVRQGDWDAVSGLTVLLGSDALPVTRDALAEYIQRVQKVLAAARVSRAGLAVSLSRVRAAAGFTHTRALQQRQGLVDPPEF